jgi:hypothetical protein
MKGLALFLTAAILLHSACLGRCWGETAAAPPCHQQEGEDAPWCSEGLSIGTKTSPVAQCVLTEAGVAPILDSLELAGFNDSASRFKTISPPALRFAVLRI